MNTMTDWDQRFLELAKHVAAWSKDPSTKCGAVIVRPDRTIASVGYNGFPRGCDDSPELYADRDVKYARVVHCEMNAILSAREPLQGYILYTHPFLTCDRCAVHVIQTGIQRVVAYAPTPEQETRWGAAFERARALYAEAGVEVAELAKHVFARESEWHAWPPAEPPLFSWSDPGDEHVARAR